MERSSDVSHIKQRIVLDETNLFLLRERKHGRTDPVGRQYNNNSIEKTRCSLYKLIYDKNP